MQDQRPRFASDTGFYPELKRQVAAYFAETNQSTNDNRRMYAKTAILLLWFGASYGLLVFAATTWWQGLLLSLSLAGAMAGIGFCVQHDANHGAYSKHRAINRVMGLTMDALGASSYLWRLKHNIAHHTYTNVDGADDDLDIGPLGRFSPQQRRRPIHRLQHYYMWAVYGLLVALWHVFLDARKLVQARIAGNRIARPRGWDLVELCAGKALFLGWAFVIPALFHPLWVVVLFYASTVFVVGLTLSVVFQLAHCVEEAQFPEPENHHLTSAWAVHQVQTTVNFAPKSDFLNWYLGGLNFQIEHHLFPRICHVHYRRMSPIVQKVCAEFGIHYASHATLGSALASHGRWLQRMGQASPA